MERDLKNVYDLSVSQNLENTDKRFAAKLADLAEPCAVDDFGRPAGEGEGDFTGTFLETGVSCVYFLFPFLFCIVFVLGRARLLKSLVS